MAVTFDQLLAGISGQESGGNYNATNARTGAAGRWQILPSNIGPWSQQYLGYRVSVNQFYNSPGLQDRLASAVLKDYYRRWGARGAAAAWYSGSPTGANNYTRFRANEPSIGEYVDGVLSKARDNGPASMVGYEPPADTEEPSRPPSLSDLLGSADGEADSSIDVGGGAGNTKIEQSGVGASAADSADAVGMSVLDNRAAESVDPSLGNSTIAGGVGTPLTGPGGRDTGEDVSTGQGASQGVPGGGSGFGGKERREIIAAAVNQVGTPYVWGGSRVGGFDCSGLVQWAYAQMGIDLPRVSYQQANAGRHISLDQLKPGDLVAWDYSGRNTGADHIAIYVGGGNIVEAPQPGERVRVRPIYHYGNTWGVDMSRYFN